MKYDNIIVSGNDFVSYIEYSDAVDDCIVYFDMDFYGVEDTDESIYTYEKIKDGQHLGRITGYLVLTDLMNKLGEDLYKICDAHSVEFEVIASFFTNHGSNDFDSDFLYIEESNLSDDTFDEIMERLSVAVMKHYHSFPEYVVCFSEKSDPKRAQYERIGFKEMDDKSFLYRWYDVDDV